MIFEAFAILAAVSQATSLVRVEPAAARATSALPDPTNYAPEYAIDDDDATAWVEGKPDLGKGEALTFALSGVKGVSTVQLDVKSGFQRSAALLTQNAAPKTLRVTVSLRGKVLVEEALTLERKMGAQSFTLPLATKSDVDEVALRIDDVLPGSKYKDTCITDVAIHVDGKVDAAIQTSNRRGLDDARARRSAAAQAMGERGLAASYRAVSSTHECAPSEPHLLTLTELIDGHVPPNGVFIEPPDELDLPVTDSDGRRLGAVTRFDLAHLKDHPGAGRTEADAMTETGFYVNVAQKIAMSGWTQRTASVSTHGRIYSFDDEGRVTSVTDYSSSDNYNDANGGTTSPSSEMTTFAFTWTKRKITRIDLYSPSCTHSVFVP